MNTALNTNSPRPYYLIGISGKMGHGKDALAAQLLSATLSPQSYQYGQFWLKRRAMADELKEEAAGCLAYAFCDDRSQQDISEQLTFWKNQLLKIFHGGKGSERKQQFRLYLQWYGTEFRRKQFGESYWTDRFEQWVARFVQTTPADFIPMIVCPDLRFPDEAECIRRLNGTLIRIHRPGIFREGPEHASETSLDDYLDWDYTVENDGSLAELHLVAERIWLDLIAPLSRVEALK